jgi:hypothetical protein
MNKEQIHTASMRASGAAHYFAMAYAYKLANVERDWPLEQAMRDLTDAVEALGYDLVKREPAKEPAQEAA